jgi:hypothetical protein
MKLIKNQNGLLLFDFIFALMLIMALSTVLLAVSFTLSVTEAVQYIAFSTSRAYYGSHRTPQEQLAAAEAKFEVLRERPSFRKLINNDWFDLTPAYGNFADDYGVGPEEGKNLNGVKILMTAKVLSFSVPLLGKSGEENDFQANVTSYIGREPTFSECRQVQGSRGNAIQGLQGGFSSLPGFQYINIGDNGC